MLCYAYDEELAVVAVVVRVMNQVVLRAHDRLGIAVQSIVDVRRPVCGGHRHIHIYNNIYTFRYVSTYTDHTHRGQRSIFTLIANSGSLHKFDNSCTARIFSLHDFQTILNAKDYGIRAL